MWSNNFHKFSFSASVVVINQKFPAVEKLPPGVKVLTYLVLKNPHLNEQVLSLNSS